MAKVNKFLLIVFSALLLSSCKDRSIYHQYSSTPTLGWSHADTLHIEPDLISSTDIDLLLEVRHSPAYPYKYLYMVCEENLTDSLIVNRDTIALNLIKPDGRIQGDGVGKIYQLKFYYKTITRPQFSTNSKLSFYHLMTDTIIDGIEDVGIRINRADDERDQHLSEGIQIIR